MHTVSNSAWALEYVSEPLKADKEIALIAIKNHEHACNFVDKSLWSDRDFVLSVSKICCCLGYANQELRDDEEIVLNYVKHRFCSLDYVSDRLKKDIYIISIAVENNGRNLFIFLMNIDVIKKLSF